MRNWGTTLRITVSIITVVVRLSRLAEMMKVVIDSAHNSRRLRRVFSNWETKSKQPLLWSISTMVIVASRKSTISAPRPTYLRKTSWAIYSLTTLLVGTAPLKKSK